MSVAPHTQPVAARDDGALARTIVFLAIFALAIVTLHPFADLREELSDSPILGRDSLMYFGFFGLATSGFVLARRYAAPAFAALTQPALIGLVGWIVISSLTSYDPATSIKRASLMLAVIAGAAATPLLPRGRSEMAQLIAISAIIPLALSYFGVVLMPDLSIHSLADTAEPDLAGAWRGIFAHKNVASPVMGCFAFFGLYVAGEGRKGLGYGIAAASILFLVFTNGKTSSALWLPALILGAFSVRAAGSFLFSALVLAPPLVMNALGFLAQLFEPLHKLASSLPFDSTFTGRSEVWAFVAPRMMERLWTGRGFGAFWDDPSIRFSTEDGWATQASHAHNGYVDATLSMGLIGLALTLWVFVVQPFRDLSVARTHGDPALTILCARIWIYGVWVSSLESFIYDRADPMWFLFLFAVFALRYLATFRPAP